MSQDANKANRKAVFPSQQSDPNVFRQEDRNQLSRMLTPSTAQFNVTVRPGFGGSDGVTSDGDKQTITKPSDAPQDLLRDVVPENDGGGSPFGIGPQSEAYVKRSRVVVNPRKGETEK